jgi:hypothetical protein
MADAACATSRSKLEKRTKENFHNGTISRQTLDSLNFFN